MSDDRHQTEFGYVGFDGDRIGGQIVRALIENNEARLISFARTVEKALRLLHHRLESRAYRVVLMTGDGRIAHGPLDPAFFRELSAEFREFTGATLSVGIGTDLRSCYLATKYAKSLGGDTLARMRNDELCPL